MQEDEEIRCGENNVEWVVCSRIYYRRNHLNQGRMSLSGKLGKCSSDRAWQPELALTLNNSILMLLLLSWTLQLSKTTNIETQRFRKTRSKKKKNHKKECWELHTCIACNSENTIHHSRRLWLPCPTNRQKCHTALRCKTLCSSAIVQS